MNSARSRSGSGNGPPDPDIRLPLADDLSAETVNALCDVLRALADTIENRYADRLLVHRRREYERDARADGRDSERRGLAWIVAGHAAPYALVIHRDTLREAVHIQAA